MIRVSGGSSPFSGILVFAGTSPACRLFAKALLPLRTDRPTREDPLASARESNLSRTVLASANTRGGTPIERRPGKVTAPGSLVVSAAGPHDTSEASQGLDVAQVDQRIGQSIEREPKEAVSGDLGPGDLRAPSRAVSSMVTFAARRRAGPPVSVVDWEQPESIAPSLMMTERHRDADHVRRRDRSTKVARGPRTDPSSVAHTAVKGAQTG
jgi:hypothetical protein